MKILISLVLILPCLCQGLEFIGKRNLTGGDTIKNCEEGLLGTVDGCKCRLDKPIFHVLNNESYGCTNFKQICKVCKNSGKGYIKGENETLTMELQLPLESIEQKTKENCSISDWMVAFRVNQQHEMIELFQKKANITWSSSYLKLMIDIDNIPFNLRGKLGKIQIWCMKENQTENEVLATKKENSFLVKLDGEFTLPDNTTYFFITTPLPPTTTIPISTMAPDEDSKNMIFYVVIPVAIFLILICIIVLCINKRDKKQRENSYNFKDPRLSGDSAFGMYNEAYVNDTLDGKAKKKPNNNDSLKDSKGPTNDDGINIYTIVDLSSQNVAERPVPAERPVHQMGNEKQAENALYESPYESPVDFQRKPSSDTDSDIPDGKYRILSNTNSGSDMSDQGSEKGPEVEPEKVKEEDLKEECDEIVRECEENYKQMKGDGTLKRLKRKSKQYKFTDFDHLNVSTEEQKIDDSDDDDSSNDENSDSDDNDSVGDSSHIYETDEDRQQSFPNVTILH
ncbi:uncharacterized protein [Clytia hemisphaerica]|uniref:Cnidarian restricted protein n=1 Tax=Clytia hemisphaerica TaxID=252671 RepID=A0A7M5WVS1_9CNID